MLETRWLGPILTLIFVLSTVGSLVLAWGLAGGKGITRVVAILGLAVLLFAGSCALFFLVEAVS